MANRRKKRVRADGTIASSKQALRPLVALAVPAVEPEQVSEALYLLRASIQEAGGPAEHTDAWADAYAVAQGALVGKHGATLGDAILWRATFLDALIEWDTFRELHTDEGDLPTPAMFRVAATIPSSGDQSSFDLASFESLLAKVEAISSPHSS